ncbi:LysR family transcriptional regulator [Polaribacter reichenbachii]|uniref:LysR family transcriptional regulator n=1 Tax=Polaribacter reichenbachii TaxID=996801 RepID=A0A1B8U4B3_9FLAO|nr:LysR family transcriptional regulator [Polaribacter reichenbachii]APZ47460.1 LysR family transcriptional regulator [Polaribacter reichenbachii]AUC18099.1 LysR family transcriptional regulator [Polaribacter reichenbachii]OBY66710.1 LysR family transcriptional regulator [Polaribacter reichenbachii]
MVNLEWYRTFKEIYENGTLTKASIALYASQPGVSVHLNALEAYVGKKLFERTSRKMIPTEDGKFLYEYIIESLKKLEIAEQHFKKTTQEKNPSLNIGMCSEMFQLIIEPEIPKLDFDLVARFGAHTDLIKDLNNGILDLVITPKQQNEKKSLVEYIPFSKERIVLIAGNKTNVTKIQKHIKSKDLSKLEDELLQNIWYSSSNEMEHFRRFWFENFNKKPAFKPNYILPNITSIIRCLNNGNGLALVPDFLCQEQILRNEINLVWEGKVKTENTLYFASRTDLKYKKELDIIKNIFTSKMK